MCLALPFGLFRSTLLRARLPSLVSVFLAVCALESGHLAASESGPTSNLFRLFNSSAASRVETKPHPAIVRVIVDEGQALSNGSGSFVAARDQHGLVVTNWHVVRDATGKIEVIFPDGFRSAATILKTDPDWDLAALLIWRANVTPLTISTTAPQTGDALTIAGYGQGDYRAVSGKCTQYVAPSTSLPYEIVELSAQARQGDSGGPILNDQGELAGVLFGASRGSTSGSYCVRVRTFLASVWPDLDAAAPSPAPAVAPFVGFTPPPTNNEQNEPQETTLVPVEAASPAAKFAAEPEYAFAEPPAQNVTVTNTPPPLPSDRPAGSINLDLILGVTNWDRGKTILAIIGLLALWGNVSRLLTK